MEFLKSILDGIINVGSLVGESVVKIYDFIISTFDFFRILVNFLPNPFRTILLSYLSLFIIVYTYQTLKG